jgi:methyltransferase (TIGR00027 family)
MKPVSKTAYYCCGVRMTDAESKRPLCGDTYARRFMDAEGMAIWDPFKREHRATRGNATRHRIIDDWLRAAVRADSNLRIVSIGAGFDSRPYRLTGGDWVELDEPALLTLKEQRLPVTECKNPLQRIAIDFASETLRDKLAPIKTDRFCIFVFEGVFMYLEPDVIAGTLATLRELFPRHELVCDLMQRAFIDRRSGSVRDKVERLGAIIRVGHQPEAPLENQGYRRIARTSVVGRSMELSLPRGLGWLGGLVPRDLLDGYWVGVYRPDLSARA